MIIIDVEALKAISPRVGEGGGGWIPGLSSIVTNSNNKSDVPGGGLTRLMSAVPSKTYYRFPLTDGGILKGHVTLGLRVSAADL